MAFVPGLVDGPIVWPNPRASLEMIYADRGVTSIVPNQGNGNYLTFGQRNHRSLQVDEVGTPAHTADPYVDDAGNRRYNHDARIPDGWELFGPTLALQAGVMSIVQCIIKIADRDRIRYVPPREKVPQQWIAVNIEGDDLPDLFDRGWQIYETPYLVEGGLIYVTLVKSPPAIPPVPPVAIPPMPAVGPAAVNIPPNVPPQGGTRRRKRNRKVHRKTTSK